MWVYIYCYISEWSLLFSFFFCQINKHTYTFVRYYCSNSNSCPLSRNLVTDVTSSVTSSICMCVLTLRISFYSFTVCILIYTSIWFCMCVDWGVIVLSSTMTLSPWPHPYTAALEPDIINCSCNSLCLYICLPTLMALWQMFLLPLLLVMLLILLQLSVKLLNVCLCVCALNTVFSFFFLFFT